MNVPAGSLQPGRTSTGAGPASQPGCRNVPRAARTSCAKSRPIDSAVSTPSLSPVSAGTREDQRP